MPTASGPGIPGGPLDIKEIRNIAALCAAAFFLRLLPILLVGHSADISTFESWLLTLAKYGPGGFYSHAGFIDYPPGYMLILWAAAGFHHLLVPLANRFDTLIVAVKMPAILADVGIVYLVYLIMRRSWSTQVALVGAAIIAALNPDIGFLSAYWGQADSVAVVFMIWAMYLALTGRYEWAWAALSFAVLIKPHPVAIAPLLLIWQIRRQGLTWRLLAIPLIGVAVAYAGAVLFAPDKSPIALLHWLYGTYARGRDGYPYNSVNAFNLYSVKNDFWQSDLLPVMLFGRALGPLWAWGVAIFVGFTTAIALRQWRTTGSDASRETAENSFLFACFLVMLGYFMLLTRMHERYIFPAVVLVVFARPLGAVQRIVALALASTFIVNLFYGLYYLKTPAADLNPLLVHSLSLVNVLCFFAVAAIYLVEELEVWVRGWLTAPPAKKAPRLAPQLLEGLIGLTRLDRWIVLGLTAATALLLFYRIAAPNERIFDEIYFARSAQEYLQHQDVFEWTHPPLVKLCMAATSWFFQIFLPAFGAWLVRNGVGFGDFFVKNQIGDPVSSRVASAIAGTLTIPVLYAFAKRLFSSTGAAVVASLLLMSSGFFFVQARTALPDIFIALFSLCALYCSYRFFTSGQIVRRDSGYPDVASNWATVGVFVALVVFIALEVAYYDPAKHPPEISWHIYLGFMALLAAFCVVWARRLLMQRREGRTVVYPDGAVVESGMVTFASGQQRPLRAASSDDGVQKESFTQDGVALTEGDVAVRWQADGTLRGAVAGVQFFDKQQWGTWLVLTGISLGAVTACKWYGIFDLATIMLAALLVTMQGFLPVYWRWRDHSLKLDVDLPRRLLWGNPLGPRLPLLLAGILFLGFALYVLTYIPYFSIGRTFQDMLNMQHSMYAYHHDLKATHIYGSPWWVWPLDVRPVAYYYHTFTHVGDPVQIVGEVTALPNPSVWLAGLITVPVSMFLAWRQRHKGMLIVVAAMFLHWLPWVGSPRVDFQYNIYNNTALVCLCTTYALLCLWRWANRPDAEPAWPRAVRWAIPTYVVLCIVMFAYFYPILGAVPIRYETWKNHMWLPSGCAPDQKQDCIGWI